MDATPKLTKRNRSSLSLGNRFKQQKHCNESPSSLPRNLESGGSRTPVSPNVFNACTETMDCTPPPRHRFDLDDSFDYSPRVFEANEQSPTDCLSQSFGSDMPDVVWNWSQFEEENKDRTVEGKLKHSSTDSGFGSAGSTTVTVRRTRSARLTYIAKRDEQRKAAEAKLRRAEKMRTEALVREKCEKLQKKLMQSQISKNDSISVLLEDIDRDKELNALHSKQKTEPSHKPEMSKDVETIAAPKPPQKHSDSFDDFFNDSDMDGLLLEATQKLEVALPAKPQPPAVGSIVAAKSKTHNTKEAITTTPKSCSHSNKKHSSSFMQFLEDDAIDDIFASIDDNWLLQATQANAKPRSPFQRYKSMPTASVTTLPKNNSSASNELSGNVSKGKTTANTNSTLQSRLKAADCAQNTIKRHSSSHALSPTVISDRDRRAKMRK